MAESIPNPPSSPQAPAPAAPAFDPNALVATFVAVIKAPTEFFKSVKGEKGFPKCLTFSVAASVVYGVLRLVWWLLYGHSIGWGIRELVQAVILGLIGPFIGGAIIWVICMIVGSKAPYEPSVHIAAYSSAVLPVSGACMLVPYIGWLGALAAGIYGIYIIVMGAKALNFEPQPASPPSP